MLLLVWGEACGGATKEGEEDEERKMVLVGGAQLIRPPCKVPFSEGGERIEERRL